MESFCVIDDQNSNKVAPVKQDLMKLLCFEFVNDW